MSKLGARLSVLLSVVMLVATPAFAGRKELRLQQMTSLAQQMLQLKANGQAGSSQYLAAESQYLQYSTALGGDDPGRWLAQPQEAGDATEGTVPAAPPNCQAATTNGANNTPVAIPDNNPTGVSSTIAIAGAGTYLWNVTLTTAITHTFAGDLDFTLTSPAGTVVTISTDNGGGNDNVFNGTLWTNSAGAINPPGPVGDNTYANLVVETPLVPEESFAAFLGENPNGTWTLTVADDASADTGTLNSWSLALTTLPAAPVADPAVNGSNNTPVAIPDNNPTGISSTINLGGAGYLCDLNLTTAITHTFAGDLDFTLTSPGGTVVTISTDNGGGNDNVFNGTLWDDGAGATNPPGPASDNAYANLVVETPLVAEEALAALVGENPAGTWTLTVADDASADTGTLNSWSLSATTCGCAGACTDYNVTTSVGQAIVPGTTLVPGSNCDDCSVAIALPFPFSFYGTPFNSVNAISNGNLQFTSNNTAFTNVCPLPTNTLNNAIIPYWDDLYLVNAGTGIFTSTSGSAPNRIFNIEWRAQYFPGSGTANFEVRLYETTNQIDFVYGTVTGGNTSATGGLQQGTGPTVEPFFCNGAGQALSPGLRGAFTCAGGGGCTITPPLDIVQNNDLNQCGAVVNYPAPTTSGQCGPITCTPPSGSFFPVGTTTVTCTDAAGGASATFDITVNDVQPPTVTAPDLVVGNDPGLCSAVVNFNATASDNCPGVGAAVCVPPSGSVFPVGVTPVNCSATDAAGNVGNDAGSIAVNDVEPPTITCPADIELDLPPASPGQNVDYDPPVAGDNCGVVYDCQPPSGDYFLAGQTPVTCTANDPASNTAQCTFYITLGAVTVLEVPTVSTLGLLALALLLAATAFVVLRRNG